MKWKPSRKFWKRLILSVLIAPVVLFSLTVTILYWKQDQIVQYVLTVLNEDFEGEIRIEDSHIAPFANFPYLSIDLEHIEIYPDKSGQSEVIVSVKDTYVGFDLWTLMWGDFQIKTIKLSQGDINLIQDKNGELNLAKALQTTKEIEDPSQEFHIDLKRMTLENVDITKLNEENGMLVDAFVSSGTIKFKSTDDHMMIAVNTDFTLNVTNHGKPTYIKNKHISIDTELDLNQSTQLVRIAPSELKLEQASFGMEGTIDLDDNLNLNLEFHGNKPNFDLFIAFAPEELIPTLQRYENKGKVFFDATLKGKAANGHFPKIDAKFGCENAYFTNTFNKKKLDNLQFKGHFKAKNLGDLTTMEFSLSDFSSRPEAGVFKGNLVVKNFVAPEVDLQLDSDFDLAFLAQFLEINDLKKLTGKVQLKMNFHDIIDLEFPERSLEQINQAYFTELKVTNLSFESPDFHLPVKDIDIHATMKGKEAKIHYFNSLIGQSDLHIEGSISDLPAIIHHTDQQVTTTLKLTSKWLDLEELTKTKRNPEQYIHEQVQKFSVDVKFKSSAKAMTESPNLPKGEFFINNLYAKFKHYPHTLHDFKADVLIDEKDFNVIDFSGEIDKTDFHFSGKLANYDLWFMEIPKGDTKIEFSLNSNRLILDNLLTYNGVNYLPEDYSHEELSEIKLLGHAAMHFRDTLHSTDIYIDRLDAKMKLHPLKLEQFKGRFHIEEEHMKVEKFSGKMGHSVFAMDLNYYYGKDPKIRKRDNYFSIQASRLDLDELTNYTPPNPGEPVDHDAVFNIYDVPFTDMKFKLNIGELNYHQYKLKQLKGTLRTKENHYIYIDQLDLDVAGGHISTKGYFNGSNSKKIYLSPEITFRNLHMDQLMLKFDNFGQDEVLSDNIQGKISGKLTGMIHVHTDMVPILDDSEIHIDLEVIDGRLNNYGPMRSLSDYFQDKNLNRIAFDTLRNHIDLKNGNLTVPEMTINTSLGFLVISGKQDKDLNMEYFVRVPFKMVTSAAASKLFGRKKEEIDPDQDDEIIRRDPDKRTAFINIKIAGTPENYKITLGKDKKK
jgi:hypothetical protein